MSWTSTVVHLKIRRRIAHFYAFISVNFFAGLQSLFIETISKLSPFLCRIILLTALRMLNILYHMLFLCWSQKRWSPSGSTSSLYTLTPLLPVFNLNSLMNIRMNHVSLQCFAFTIFSINGLVNELKKSSFQVVANLFKSLFIVIVCLLHWLKICSCID